MANPKNLFHAFPPTSKSEWLQKLTKDLKGRSPEELNWQITDNVTLAPFYHPDDAIDAVEFPLSDSQDIWEISEDFRIDDNITATNKTLLAALEAGIQAPRFIFNDAPDVEDWAALLKGINLEWISTHLFCESGTNVFRACVSLGTYIKANYPTNAIIKGTVNTDYWHSFNPRLYMDYAALLRDELPHFQLFTIDGVRDCTDTNNTLTELLGLIQKGNQLLDFYQKAGLDLDWIARNIQFSVGIGTSYFVQIAKIRALKILWANICEAYKIKNLHCTIEAHFPADTQDENENTNMIRATTQAMSAVLGGVNRLNILPANARTTTPNDFTRRIARNVQHLLKMESHLDEVQDPAAGSYYIEKLTEELALQTWTMFQQL